MREQKNTKMVKDKDKDKDKSDDLISLLITITWKWTLTWESVVIVNSLLHNPRQTFDRLR